jgi:hypothetical protein
MFIFMLSLTARRQILLLAILLTLLVFALVLGATHPSLLHTVRTIGGAIAAMSNRFGPDILSRWPN